jgi:hypothetical protein
MKFDALLVKEYKKYNLVLPNNLTFGEDIDTGADINLATEIPGAEKQKAEVAANVDKRSKLNSLISSTLDLLIKKAQDNLTKTKSPNTAATLLSGRTPSTTMNSV